MKLKKKYYKTVTLGNCWSNNYIEYESNGYRNKTLSIEQYVNKYRPCLKYIINDLKSNET